MPRTLLRLSILAAATAASAPLQSQAPTRVMGAPYHDASRAFIDLMIPHHDMATMMSEHAATAARTDAVKALARKMADAQKKELAELKAMRKTLFGSDSSRTSMMHSMMQMMGMHRMTDSGAARPMVDSMAMRRDTTAHAAHQVAPMPMMSRDFDRMFLEHMISHYQDAIEVSLLAEHSDATRRVKELAKKAREGQEREIAEMRRILASLPAAPAPGTKP